MDPLDSTSRIMDPNVIGHEHYGVARGVQKILQVIDLKHLDTDTLNQPIGKQWRNKLTVLY